MSKDSSDNADQIKETLDKAKKDISKGLLSGFNKLKKNIETGIADSNIQEHINQGDMDQIAESGKVLQKAVAKGAAEGISDVVSAISSGGNALFNSFNTKKKEEKRNSDIDEEFDDYEIIDEQ
ncbi:MAG: hypothetical protein GPJ54_09355 [Candidatus Heimdallarchaeota archaeon]|nr:hypothetical protein [Candidatus Heimdallarchaeota archaeon]